MARLGKTGAVGIIGVNGVCRVRRSGNSVFYGDAANYSDIIIPDREVHEDMRLSESAWDGIPRYLSTRQLYKYPLAIVAGLSPKEKLAETQQAAHKYFFRAAVASIAIVFLIADAAAALLKKSAAALLSTQVNVEVTRSEKTFKQ